MRAAVSGLFWPPSHSPGAADPESGSHATQRDIDAADQEWVESMLLTEEELPAGWSPDLDESPNPPDDCEQIDFSDLVITGEADTAFERGETERRSRTRSSCTSRPTTPTSRSSAATQETSSAASTKSRARSWPPMARSRSAISR